MPVLDTVRVESWFPEKVTLPFVELLSHSLVRLTSTGDLTSVASSPWSSLFGMAQKVIMLAGIRPRGARKHVVRSVER